LHDPFELVAVVDGASVGRRVRVPRLGILELMAIASQRAAALAADLPGNAGEPGLELLGFAKRLKLPVSAEKALLDHVARRGPIGRNAGRHSGGQPGIPVVQSAERLAISGQRCGHQLGVGRLVRVHAFF
jgi:hypothetical protein